MTTKKVRPGKPKIVGRTGTFEKRVPTPLCPDGHGAMVYSAELGYWFCPASCANTRRAGLPGDAGEVTRIKGEPRLVVKYDEDGDPHHFLLYPDQSLMIELPFGLVRSHVPNMRSTRPHVDATLRFDNFVVLDKEGAALAAFDIQPFGWPTP